jgi:hypothetical protein
MRLKRDLSCGVCQEESGHSMLLLLKTFNDALARAPSPGDLNGKVVYLRNHLASSGRSSFVVLVKMVKQEADPIMRMLGYERLRVVKLRQLSQLNHTLLLSRGRDNTRVIQWHDMNRDDRAADTTRRPEGVTYNTPIRGWCPCHGKKVWGEGGNRDRVKEGCCGEDVGSDGSLRDTLRLAPRLRPVRLGRPCQ